MTELTYIRCVALMHAPSLQILTGGLISCPWTEGSDPGLRDIHGLRDPGLDIADFFLSFLRIAYYCSWYFCITTHYMHLYTILSIYYTVLGDGCTLDQYEFLGVDK